MRPAVMVFVVGMVVAGVYALLSAIHVFWAIRRQPAGAGVIPEVGGKPTFAPSPITTLAVAAALAVACTVVLAQASIVALPVPATLVRIAAGVLGVMFLLRAIGDFRLVGFFKRVKGTPFARNDSLYFSPLCLVLGSAVVWLATR